jgi:hypothetical protein
VVHGKQRLVVFSVIEAEVFSGHLQSCRGLLSHRRGGDRRHSLDEVFGCEMKGVFHASDRRGGKKKDVVRRKTW